jgi:hypothetical protein
MGIKEALFHGVATLIIERPAKAKTYDQWLAALEQSGQEIEQRAAAAQDAAKAQAVMRHITGIERWCQNRLRMFLGGTFQRDEYDGYQPGAGLDLPGQVAAFHETRQETVGLARELQAAVTAGKLAETATVMHNDFGPLTARGWLAYIVSHASRESTKIK